MNRKEGKVYYLPINNNVIDRAIVSVSMNCRGCYRGIQKAIYDMYGVNVSIGHIFNVMTYAVTRSTEHNMTQSLEGVNYGANDELFHLNAPILAGVDIESLYCYLLQKEEQRDGETWWYHLVNLEDRSFQPNYTVCDQGAGLKKGQLLAFPEIPCHGDVFHIIKMMRDMLRFFKNRHKKVMRYRKGLEAKQLKCHLNKKSKKLSKKANYARKLSFARKDEARYRSIEADLKVLVSWMEYDILSVAGGDPLERYELYDFIVAEFKLLAHNHPHRIKEVSTALINQKESLLGFTKVMESQFNLLSNQFNVPKYLIWELCKLQKYTANNYYKKRQQVLKSLTYRCYEIEESVRHIMSKVQRASSIVENFNSRIRPYLTVKKQVNNEFLELLRFYMNHTPIMRSSKPERQGKTPSEILNNAPHPHWLEMLGFSPLKLAA